MFSSLFSSELLNTIKLCSFLFWSLGQASLHLNCIIIHSKFQLTHFNAVNKIDIIFLKLEIVFHIL